MKKFFSIAMAAVMLVALCSTVFAAGDPTLTVGTVDGYRGEEVVVPIVVSNNPGIAAASLSVTFDTENLSLEKVEAGPDFPGMIQNSAKIVWLTSSSDVAANSAILNLTFKVLDTTADGTYPITIAIDQNGGATNMNEDSIAFATVDGAIKVAEKPVVTTTEAPVVTTTKAPAATTEAPAAVVTTTAASTDDKKESPKTADAGIAVAAVALAAAACFVATKKRK